MGSINGGYWWELFAADGHTTFTPGQIWTTHRWVQQIRRCTGDRFQWCIIIGIRIVTHYIHEVYTVVNLLKQEFDIQEECDYIAKPKASGYRSYHLILRVPVSKTSIPFPYGDHMTVEVQIRTMGMDFWASLEHSLVYDRTKTAGTLVPDSLSLVHNELLNYADNIFSIDMRIQALQHLTEETMPPQKGEKS